MSSFTTFRTLFIPSLDSHELLTSSVLRVSYTLEIEISSVFLCHRNFVPSALIWLSYLFPNLRTDSTGCICAHLLLPLFHGLSYIMFLFSSLVPYRIVLFRLRLGILRLLVRQGSFPRTRNFFRFLIFASTHRRQIFRDRVFRSEKSAREWCLLRSGVKCSLNKAYNFQKR